MPFNRWRVQLFGVLQVTAGDQTITRFRTQATAALFAYLAFHNGRPQPREVLINEFWGDASLKQGRGLLSHALSSLRSQFAVPGSEVLLADNFTVALNSALFDTDVATFHNALKRARRSGIPPGERRALLEEAVANYQSDLLVGQFSLWITPEMERLRAEFEKATSELAALKDIPVSVTVGEIEAPTVTESRVSTLPPTYTRFFGRKEALDHLTESLAPSSDRTLITLTGIGGIGKTRLAHEVARQLEDTYRGRVWFAELAEVRDSELLMDTIQESLRIPKDPESDPLTQCSELLAGAPSLLILDNMEQFVAEGRAGAILQTLRARVPSMVCLVTSRQVLGINGEQSVPIGPLIGAEEATSIQLFEDRARAVRPDFSVSDANYAVVQQICALLEGIPLAIELAAARISMFTPSQLIDQIERRFALLRTRKRDAPTRHQSLWTAIDSRYQLLPDELRRVSARLSVFRGGWTLASVQAICLDQDVDEGEVMPLSADDAIDELQEAPLIFAVITPSNTPRFQMLDTLREYAAEQLRVEGDEETTRQRHAAFYSQLAVEAEPFLRTGTGAEKPWLDKLQEDHDNIRLAMSVETPEQVLRSAVAIHRFWRIRGHASEGHRRLQSALKATDYLSGDELARARNALGVLAYSAGALTEAWHCYEQVLEYYESRGEQEHVAQTLNNLATVATKAGDLDGARRSYEQSLVLYRANGNSLRYSIVLANLAGVLMLQNDFGTARPALEECVQIQKNAGDDSALVATLQNLAEVALRQDDIDVASAALRESMALRRVLGYQFLIDDVLVTASMILGKRDRIEDACVVWSAAQRQRSLAGTGASELDVKDEETLFTRIRQKISAATIVELQQKGIAMSFEQAIAYVETVLANVR